MTSLAKKEPVNQREFSYYLLFAVLILFLVFMAGLSLLYALPQNSDGLARVEIGSVTDFPTIAQPYAVTIDGTSLFIVHTKTGWLALDRQTPVVWADQRCLFSWEEANGRFVDPCSGSKFSLDGHLLEGPATQSLDQYPITEQSGKLFVDMTTLIPGESSE